MRIGLLTGGGDVPGLNAAIRAVVKRAEIGYGHTVIGFHNGWRGVVDGNFAPISRSDLRNALTLGGTMLGTSRFHPQKEEGGVEAALQTLKSENIEALICIGGDGTLKSASKIADEGVRIVGIPKTIDNDVWGTDLSIGFHTALNIATEAIDRIHTTAESHNRVMVVEVMGHTNGWIAVQAGIAGGADVVLIPETPFDMDEIVTNLKLRHRSHANFSIVCVAEGAMPQEGTSLAQSMDEKQSAQFNARSIGERVAESIAAGTGFDTRVTVLGHVQRGGSPTPTDRVLASRFGVAAVDAIADGKTGVMTALKGVKIKLVPLSDIAGKRQLVPDDLIQVANNLA